MSAHSHVTVSDVSPYSIRFGTANDHLALKALYVSVAHQGDGIARRPHEISDEFIAKVIHSSLRKGLILVMQRMGSDELIGCIHAVRVEPEDLSHVMGGLTILIHPSFQKRGLGKKLFLAFFETVRTQFKEIFRVEIRARASNVQALQLYENLGFSREGLFHARIRTSQGHLDDGVPMVWFNPEYPRDFKAPGSNLELQVPVTALERKVRELGSKLKLIPIESRGASSKKSQFDLQLQEDLEMETALFSQILGEYPNHSILGEERGYREGTNSRFLWIVDPLCGSNNFHFGFPAYGISIALAVDNVLQYGLIYLPESDMLMSAWRGSQAIMNGNPIRVSNRSKLSEALILYDNQFASIPAAANNFESIWKKSMAIRITGSAAWDNHLVASGRADARIYHQTKLVDFAAAAVIVPAAGGEVSDLNGRPVGLDTTQVIVSNGTGIHGEILTQLSRPLQIAAIGLS